MRRIVLLCLIFVSVLLGGCNLNTNSEREPIEIEESEHGTFSTYYHETNMGTFETGPIIIDVEEMYLVQSDLETESTQVISSEESQDYITFLLSVSSEVSEGENIEFSPDHLTLSTNTGEHFESPHDTLSDTVDIQYIGSNTVRRIAYILEDSKASEIDNVHFKIKAPTNEDNEKIGEDIELNIDMTER
ncbi:hypothetical protein SAMN05421734_11316 [Pelagirhabdus alkalitolerans]|uniref:DUF4352 domain-containing protein n=1 Tax=Pelagirhabdus alkalitolerans TaxID=1612202 RepID=A0A1G6MYX4_9BACI|nr:hypothetical protein [Pelagirhabdus alkalitolerans]SDC60760.1 hypothetical protein SAMN05421734_11316 [Pelagirhabdus alkalitolerans]